MKKFGFALVGTASLVLAGCNSSSNEDSLSNADATAAPSNLDALANNAAEVAADAEALGNQAQQLEQQATNTPATDEFNASGTTEGEENVSGM